MSEFLQDETRKFVLEIRNFEGGKYITLQLWEREENYWQPSHHCLLIPLSLAGKFRTAINKLFKEIDKT